MRTNPNRSWWLILVLFGVAFLLGLSLWDYLWINVIHGGSVHSP